MMKALGGLTNGFTVEHLMFSSVDMLKVTKGMLNDMIVIVNPIT